MSEIRGTDKRAAGATEKTADVKGKILEFAWHLKKMGRAEETIKNYNKRLTALIKLGADLEDPESVKGVLAKANKSENWKASIVVAYSSFLKFQGRRWEPPKYWLIQKIPFIPTEQEIDDLIAFCGRKTSPILQLLKETGMRISEALSLKWIDIDLQRRLIILNDPKKHGRPRIFNISQKLTAMLNQLPRKSESVFNRTRASVETSFIGSRRRAAEKLNNPRLLRIHLHTFRHWKATTEYHKTKDILHVQQLLGHRRLDHTTLYVQIEKTLFQQASDEFHSDTAKTVEEAKKLIEAGFEYVTTYNNIMLFRKRK